MIKSVEIKTTYGSYIMMDTCFHVDMKMDTIKIVYLHNNYIKEMKMRLSDIESIKIEIRRK